MNHPISPTRVIGGRYVVLAELGRGGMGVVWRAEDRVMGRHVAVKELHLPPGLSADDHRLFRERLLREARTAGRLNDPSIVTVYDVIADDGVDHIVMELIEARTLAEVVATSGPLDENAVLTIAQQMLTALRTAHDSGVVHRDVKPSNVMLAAGGRVKLTDFGIAQAADDPRLTSTGAMIGSPGYMAPERLEGDPATPASDLWALGATLCFALQGNSPFSRETTAATISAVLYADMPTIRTRSQLGAVIAGLLQRSPQARLGAAQALAVLAAPNTAQMAGPMQTTGGTPLPAARRSNWKWAVGAVVVALVAGLVGGYVLGTSVAPPVATFTYGPDGDLPAFAISSKYCIQGQPAVGRSFSSGSTIDCDSPHDLELFSVQTPFSTSDSVSYPGRAPLAAYAGSMCSMLFNTDIIVPEGKTELQVLAVIPSEQAFSHLTSSSYDMREVMCLIRNTNTSQLTGTRIAKANS